MLIPGQQRIQANHPERAWTSDWRTRGSAASTLDDHRMISTAAPVASASGGDIHPQTQTPPPTPTYNVICRRVNFSLFSYSSPSTRQSHVSATDIQTSPFQLNITALICYTSRSSTWPTAIDTLHQYPSPVLQPAKTFWRTILVNCWHHRPNHDNLADSCTKLSHLTYISSS